MAEFKDKHQQSLTEIRNRQLKEHILRIIWEDPFFKELWIQKLRAKKNSQILERDVLEDLPQNQKELIAWGKALKAGKLQEILKACNFITEINRPKFSFILLLIHNLFQSVINSSVELFKIKYNEFLNQGVDFFHQIRVIFESGRELNVKESKASVYSDLFIGEDARSIYRDKLRQLEKGQLREGQLFNLFLKYVVKPCLNSKKSHLLLKAAEQLILGINQNQILEMLKVNLHKAGILTNVGNTQDCIEIVIKTVSNLIEKIKQQRQQLIDYKLTKEEKNTNL